jgi:hypothetical protein
MFKSFFTRYLQDFYIKTRYLFTLASYYKDTKLDKCFRFVLLYKKEGKNNLCFLMEGNNSCKKLVKISFHLFF